MYSGSWKLEKIEESDYYEVLCTRGHENWRKLKRLIFGKFCVFGHGNWRKLKSLIFMKFHVPGVMEIRENELIKNLTRH